MSRFFPSFGRRSRQSREHHRDEYDQYDDHGRYNQHVSPSAWSRVVPKSQSREHVEQWDEEALERPDSYTGLGSNPSQRSGPSYNGYDRHHRRPTVHDDSDRLSESTIADSYDDHLAHDSTIPIVQRESSLTRLQEAFAEHAPSTRPVTEVNLPQQNTGSSMYQTTDRLAQTAPVPPVGRIYSNATAELRNVYAGAQQPILVPNMTANSHHADVLNSHSRRAREKRPQYYGELEQSRYKSDQRHEYRPRPRRDSSSSSRSQENYPPCVVVVERGRHGKKDTYYIIPGGAPVIFEDDKGNELTRVGDFTGRYRPQPQRPVIIEDSEGREIGRLGFDDESSLDYPYRSHNSSDEDLYDRERARGYDFDYERRSKDSRDPRYRSSSRSHKSYESSSVHSSKHVGRDAVRHEPIRGRSPPSGSHANVVYIPYADSQSSHSTRTPSRHSGRSSGREYEPSRSSHRSHDTSPVIHLNNYQRQSSGSASSRSSGRRSHDSERRR